MKAFEGRTAVITGAASGFGLEIARMAADRKMRLVLADVQRVALDRAVRELEGAGAEVLGRVTDVSKADEVDALANETRERFGVPHLLFNNAGVGAGGFIWDASQKDWEWVLGVNLWGVIHGIRAFVRDMVVAAQDDDTYEGHVVNTASMAGVVSMPLMGVYSASKHAVVSISESLHLDLQLAGSRVGASVLCPFFVPTGIADSERNRPQDKVNDRAVTVSQAVAASMVAKAMRGAKVTAPEVARMTFDAIEQSRFYVFSHPHALSGVTDRMNRIVSGESPSDPLGERPELRELMKSAVGKKTNAGSA